MYINLYIRYRPFLATYLSAFDIQLSSSPVYPDGSANPKEYQDQDQDDLRNASV